MTLREKIAYILLICYLIIATSGVTYLLAAGAQKCIDRYNVPKPVLVNYAWLLGGTVLGLLGIGMALGVVFMVVVLINYVWSITHDRPDINGAI